MKLILSEADWKRLSGLTVANLGMGGYGPFQYLEVLKRYGLRKNQSMHSSPSLREMTL